MGDRIQPLWLQVTPWGVQGAAYTICPTGFMNFKSSQAATAICTPPFPLLVLLLSSSLGRFRFSIVTEGGLPQNATDEGELKRISWPSGWILLLALSCFFKSWKIFVLFQWRFSLLLGKKKNEGKRNLRILFLSLTSSVLPGRLVGRYAGANQKYLLVSKYSPGTFLLRCAGTNCSAVGLICMAEYQAASPGGGFKFCRILAS